MKKYLCIIWVESFRFLPTRAVGCYKQGYCNIKIFGDKAYVSKDIQLDLFETAHIELECPYRENQKDWKPTFSPYAKARKRIETLFS